MMQDIVITIDEQILEAARGAEDFLPQRRCEICPIALDLIRQGMAQVRVSRSVAVFIDRAGARRRVLLSQDAQNFVELADISEDNVEPCSFPLGVKVPS
jgi:hypothetical protein